MSYHPYASQRPRALTLFFKDNKQKCKFLPSGTREDFLAGVREVLAVSPDAPLRFRDAAGDLVVVSPMGIPSGSELHVAVEEGVPIESFDNVTSAGAGAVDASKTPSDPWRAEWVRCVNGSITMSGAFYTSKGAPIMATTAPLPAKGTYAFAVSFDDRACCVSVGFINSTTCTLPELAFQHHGKYPALVELYCIGVSGAKPGSYDGPAAVIEFHYDADKHTAVVVPAGESLDAPLAMRVSNVPPSPVFVVAAHKHSIEAKFVPVQTAGQSQARG